METIQLNNDTYLTIQTCPSDYFGDPNKQAERITLFKNNEKVLTWDVYMNDDTRFTLLFEAEMPYRNGKWMDVLKSCDPGSLSRFDRPYAVWYKVGSWIISAESDATSTLKSLNEQNILKTQKAFAYGAINAMLAIQEPPETNNP